MELLRIIKRSSLYISFLLLLAVIVTILQVNSSHEKKVYGYYNDLIENYLVIQEENIKTDYAYINRKFAYPDEDKIYVIEAINLLNNKMDYINQDKKYIYNNYKRTYSSSLFSDEKDYYLLNANKYMTDFQKIENINISLKNTTAIEKVIKNSQIPIILLISISLIIVCFVDEKEKNMAPLIHSGKNGRVTMAFRRIGILAFYSVLLSFIFNGVLYAIYLKIYGGDINCPIQCSDMFSMLPYRLNVIQFFVWYCVISAISLIAIGLLEYLVISILDNYKIAIVIMFAIFGAEYLLYKHITSDSMLCVLKYINIINVCIPGKPYFTYENWGFYGFITDVSKSTLLMTLIFIIVGFVGKIIYVRYGEYPIKKIGFVGKVFNNISEKYQRLFVLYPLWLKEFHKTICIQKGAVIFIVMIYLFNSCGIQKGYDYNEIDYVLSKFYDEFDGCEPNERSEVYLQQIEREIEYYNQKENLDEISKDNLQRYQNSYKYLKDATDYAKGLKERGIDSVYIRPDTYNDIFGKRLFDNNNTFNLIAIIAMILLATGDFSYEKNRGMYIHLRSAKNRKNVWMIKIIKLVVIAAFVWGVSVIMYFTNLTKYYNLNQLDAPIQALKFFSDFPLRITIRQYIVALQLVRYIMILAIGVISYVLSFFIKYKNTLIVALSMLVPHIMYVIGWEWFRKFSVVVMMDVNRTWITYGNSVVGLILPIFVMMTALISYIFCRKKFLS
ncbi:MAG: hypothetical protein Q4F06_09650 [Eubacteriales bacterium]|nr:hypothetical protein [Eubacteriales bacterium]